LGKAGSIGLTRVRALTNGHENGKPWVFPSYVLGHTSQQDANVVSILSHERPNLFLPSKPLLGGSWILKFFIFQQRRYEEEEEEEKEKKSKKKNKKRSKEERKKN